jgi:electron-transferring-flavoprotein dehydrogenase
VSKTFKPAEYRKDLDLNKIILKETPNTENVPMDVLFVGGGPAGLAGAIELARLVKKDNESGGGIGSVEIGVLEKSESLGEHCLSGAVINPVSLRELFPELKDSDFPFRKKVESESVYMLTEKSSICIPTPPTMHNKSNYVASICEVVKWLGSKAEENGINIFTSFPAESLLVEGHRVMGVRTVAAGLGREGQPTEKFMPPTDVTAQVTVLSEGVRGPLTQGYIKWQGLEGSAPQIYALGVKELWKVKKPLKDVIHTLGWPLPTTAFGGSFMYPMSEDTVSLGLVVGLDYREHNLDVHRLLQKMKTHPLFAKYLEGGELLEWGAKTIPEGGFHALPKRLTGDGLMMTGDAAGFVNVPALKGIHYAIQSGILAARATFKALKAKDTTAQGLASYDETIKNSFIYDDLKKVRNMRSAFKSGFYLGGMKAGLMTLTGGAFPPAGPDHQADV